MATIVALLIGLTVGVLAAWLVLGTRIQQAAERARSEADAERATLSERARWAEKTIAELRNELEAKAAQITQSQELVSALKVQSGQLTQALENERQQAHEKLAVLDEAQQKLADAFKALAAEALKSNNQSFLDLAKTRLETFQETAKGEMEKRELAITELVKPLKESLAKVDTKIEEIEKSRLTAYSGLTEQVKSMLESQRELRTETSNLARALRTPNVRGRWGEIQLKRVVELAGMQEHCDFFEQQTIEGEEGRIRPDLLVRLPGRKNIVVDAKVPLTSYLEAIEATDDETRKNFLIDHARQVKNHMTALSKKAYQEKVDSAPEFVILFLPGEAFFSEAVSHDPSLIEFGVNQNVVIATPLTLIALLRAVAYGWRQEQLAQNAHDISELGRELYKRLSTFGGHMAKLGKNLEQATVMYNQAVATLETRVLVNARKFKELGAVAAGDEIDEISPIETIPRLLQSPELLNSDETTTQLRISGEK